MAFQTAITPGIPDSLFIRGKVPMTKQEIRVISLCRLHLSKDSVLYDIGSGTGSIAIEAASLSASLKVIAIESEAQALALIKENLKHFSIPQDSVQVIEALAPDGFESLPPPTHAFIGGTRGRLKEILQALYKKNPETRVVITAVTIESIAKIQEVLKEFSVKNLEISQVSVSRAEECGSYHILKAQNPVFITSFDFVPAGSLADSAPGAER